jgi:hypothetical protein
MRYTIFAAVAAMSLFVGQASAGTLSYTGVSYPTDYTVNLTDSALGVNETVYTGPMTLSGTVSDGNPIIAFYAWCVDITHNLMGSGTYISGQAPAVAGITDPTKIDNIAQLIYGYTPGNDLNSAATQVAIWEIEYGSDLQVSGNTAVTNAAQVLINGLTGSPVAGYSLQILDRGSDNNQDLAYLDPTNVMEPASTAMFGVGLIGLGLVNRRRART